MGAWGYQPYDNDAAGDWIASVSDKVATEIRRVLKFWKSAPFEVIAAAQLAVDMSDRAARLPLSWSDEDLLVRARDAVMHIRDTDWAKPWNDPKYAAREIDRLIANLNGRIDHLRNIKSKLRFRRPRRARTRSPKKKAA